MVLGAVACPDSELEEGGCSRGTGVAGECVVSGSGTVWCDHSESLAAEVGLCAKGGISEANRVGFNVACVAKGYGYFVTVIGFAHDSDIGRSNVDRAGIWGLNVPDSRIPDVEINTSAGNGDIEEILLSASVFPSAVSHPRNADIEKKVVFVDSGGGFWLGIPQIHFAEVGARSGVIVPPLVESFVAGVNHWPEPEVANTLDGFSNSLDAVLGSHCALESVFEVDHEIFEVIG